MPWGKIVGLAVGALLSYFFILPADVLNIELAVTSISDLLRVFGAVVVTVMAIGIGHFVDAL